MSTRSLICRQTRKGIEAIYCHNDGGPNANGAVIKAHYTTDARVKALLNLGDLSQLGPALGRKHDFETHGKNPNAVNWCLAYGRDREDAGTAKEIIADEDRLFDCAVERWADYIYLFRNGTWSYMKRTEPNGWITL